MSVSARTRDSSSLPRCADETTREQRRPSRSPQLVLGYGARLGDQRGIDGAGRLPDQCRDRIGGRDKIAFELRDRGRGLRALGARLLDIEAGDQSRLVAPARDLEIVVLIGERIARNRELPRERTRGDGLRRNRGDNHPLQIGERVACGAQVRLRGVDRPGDAPEQVRLPRDIAAQHELEFVLRQVAYVAADTGIGACTRQATRAGFAKTGLRAAQPGDRLRQIEIVRPRAVDEFVDQRIAQQPPVGLQFDFGARGIGDSPALGNRLRFGHRRRRIGEGGAASQREKKRDRHQRCLAGRDGPLRVNSLHCPSSPHLSKNDMLSPAINLTFRRSSKRVSDRSTKRRVRRSISIHR